MYLGLVPFYRPRAILIHDQAAGDTKKTSLETRPVSAALTLARQGAGLALLFVPTIGFAFRKIRFDVPWSRFLQRLCSFTIRQP